MYYRKMKIKFNYHIFKKFKYNKLNKNYQNAEIFM